MPSQEEEKINPSNSQSESQKLSDLLGSPLSINPRINPGTGNVKSAGPQLNQSVDVSNVQRALSRLDEFAR